MRVRVGVMLRVVSSCAANGGHLQYFKSIKLYSTSSPKTKPTFEKYLVQSLGFSEQQSLSTSARLAKYWETYGEKRVSNFKFSSNANSVVNFFKCHGFNDTQIRKIVCFEPRFLAAKVDKTLNPKFRVLQDQGFSGSDIVEIISANPWILQDGVDSSMLPDIRTLREVLGCDSQVISFYKKCHFMRNLYYLSDNVALLRSYGLSLDLIRKRILHHSGPFLQPTKTLEDIVLKVEKLGIPRDSRMFLNGIRLLSCLSEKTIESKCQLFKNFGWTESDINGLIKVFPDCLWCSEAVIRGKLCFLMKELGYEPAYMRTRPGLLTFSLEKRVVPRHRILQVLREKGLVKKDYSLYSALVLTEIRFLNQLVVPFEEVHELYSQLTGHPIRLPIEELQKATCSH